MYTDLFGKTRYKVNLHTHTTLSDGRLSPEEALARYRSAGYDAVALTDHWHYGLGGDSDGLTVISGAEYNLGKSDCREGVYHIVALGCSREPSVSLSMQPQAVIDAIHAADGVAVLAHPAWSLNTPQQMLQLRDVDATEIHNTVSGVHHSRRPDSSVLVDMIASSGRIYPLLATDDTHYYDNDDCVSFIMAEADGNSQKSILDAVRAGRFYASQGPEIHLLRDGNGFTVRCTPVREIVFYSNFVWSPRVFEGNGLTEASYTPQNGECFIRAEVVDADGKHAWSNIIPLE